MENETVPEVVSETKRKGRGPQKGPKNAEIAAKLAEWEAFDRNSEADSVVDMLRWILGKEPRV